MKLQIMSDLHFEMHADGGAELIRELDPTGDPCLNLRSLSSRDHRMAVDCDCSGHCRSAAVTAGERWIIPPLTRLGIAARALD